MHFWLRYQTFSKVTWPLRGGGFSKCTEGRGWYSAPSTHGCAWHMWLHLSNSLQDYISRIAPVIPSKNLLSKFQLVKKQKSQTHPFCNSKNFECDWSIKRPPHDDFAWQQLKKDFTLCQYKFATFFNPSDCQNPIFRPFEPSSEVIMHFMECTWVKHTHLPNIPICILQLSTNITKVTHLSSSTLTIFSHYDTSKWSQFSYDHAVCKSHSCHYTTLEFHKLGVNTEQTTCFITNYSNFRLKSHLNHSNLPCMYPDLCQKNPIFTFFIFDSIVSQVKIVQMPHSIIHTLSTPNVLLTSSYDNTFLSSESPNPKNYLDSHNSTMDCLIHTN